MEGQNNEGAATAAPSAVFTVTEHDDGRITFAVDHAHGGFIVSSPEVGKAIVEFLNHATATDIAILHGHLLHAYVDARALLDSLPEGDEEEACFLCGEFSCDGNCQ